MIQNNDPQVGQDHFFLARGTGDAPGKTALSSALVLEGEDEHAVAVVAEALRFKGRARVSGA